MTLPEEPRSVIIARALIDNAQENFNWLKSSFKFLTGKELDNTHELDINEYWKEEYGQVQYMPLGPINGHGFNRDRIWWVRPDGGPSKPHFVMPSESRLSFFFMYIWLNAFMMTELLQSNNLTSFAQVGGPPVDWNHYHVYLDQKELGACINACALTGVCEVYAKNDKGQHIVDDKGDLVKENLKGSIIIARTKEKPFF